eukprot:CAMPEP_0185015984 /NCGR_PEP_ID=MMETSP1098-20130426/100118_1 /TAXON_ID=89044 /ORGANISM="Spumella elongata, Strain CCAP 955/1" /LENGTH=645 /DNA_ID=CAMNT_0027545133 /DNA_START=39 /DNA_END=1976 /DNA_ORIENTATION=-
MSLSKEQVEADLEKFKRENPRWLDDVRDREFVRSSYDLLSRFPLPSTVPAPAPVAPSTSPADTGLDSSGPLATFWRYVVLGKVEEGYTDTAGLGVGDGESVKIVSFSGHEDDTHDCAKWGPSHKFAVLVERDEYVRCWNIIRSKKLEYILLRGTKGIGKSVFIYWLIYKLVQAARDSVRKKKEGDSSTSHDVAASASKTADASLFSHGVQAPEDELNEILPTFLLITSGTEGGKLYQLLSVVDGLPVVRRVNSDVSADYVLSDVEYDLAAHTGNWNLNVVSYGASREPDIFRSKVWDAQEAGLEMIMQPCTLDEIQAMSGPISASNATFSYAVFGGSARMACMLNTALTGGTTGGSKGVVTVVRDELKEYFAGSVYAESAALIEQAARIIAKMVSITALKGGETEASQASAVQHSLFVHTYLDDFDSLGGSTTRTDFASTFMSILAGTLVHRDELSVLNQLRNILTGSGEGILFEAQVHKTLFEKFRNGGDLRLTRIYPSGHQRLASDRDFEELRIIVNKKVLIRSVDDIAMLKPNEYGLPMIFNFPLVDAVIKVGGDPGYGIELQVTIADAHTGALNKHPSIEDKMGTPSARNKMIFCCCTGNFASFKYVEGLVPEVFQYKMLCEWEADPRNPMKKQNTSSGRK